jgi:hypothetical protein
MPEGTIVFPTPDLVYADIYMVGVPYFLGEILCVQAHTSRRRKKTRDPNCAMSGDTFSMPPLPRLPPPLPPLNNNTNAGATPVVALPHSASGGNAHVDNAKSTVVDPPRSPPRRPYFDCLPSRHCGNRATGR